MSVGANTMAPEGLNAAVGTFIMGHAFQMKKLQTENEVLVIMVE